MNPDTRALLDEATAHLDAAAALAARGDTPADHARAGLIRLTRAGLDPDTISTADQSPGPETVAGRLRAALAALDRVDPLDGPPDLLAWSWHLAALILLPDHTSQARA